ncbi:unnamed protein product [Rhizophagus irregularis]|nr:unnamed protein product [Rhizophagus irregularis]
MIKIRKIDIFKDNLGPFVLIIPPSVTGGNGPPGSPGGVVSETFSNNGTNKKQNKNNENNELSENYDSQASQDIEGNSNKKHVRKSDEENNSEDLNFEAKFIKLKKFNELDMGSIRLAEDLLRLLDHIGKLPNNPPICDKVVFSKKEKYREALISRLEKINVAEEFKFFHGTQRINLIPDNQKNCDKQKHAIRSFKTLPIRVQEISLLTEFLDEFKKVAQDLSEDIFFSIMGEANEQGNKEIA